MHSSFVDLISTFEDCCSVSRVAVEKGKRFEIISNENFTKLRIDGGLITSNQIQKCDFGFLRYTNEDFYFVELKGKDIEKAYKQILSTIDYFNQNLIRIPQNKRYFFIVSSAGIPKARTKIQNLKQDFAKKGYKLNQLVIENMVIRHTP